ncbi:MAG: dihydrolipoamide acetyltransferase family protein, partial [Planctomycetota bacterium]
IRLGQTVPLSRIQKITAQRMLQSKREIPCFYLTVRPDVTELVDIRTRTNQNSDVKISYNDFIIRAVAAGLEKFPLMTGTLEGEVIRLPDTINVGLAIAIPDGLVAPVIANANKKDLTQIARDSSALVQKAQANKLAPTDLEGACITVSNLGSFGIESFIPIVIPGQSSILGVGRITDTCAPNSAGRDPAGAAFAVRKLMNLTLSVDHRTINGSYAAQFLDFVRKLLEDARQSEIENAAVGLYVSCPGRPVRPLQYPLANFYRPVP